MPCVKRVVTGHYRELVTTAAFRQEMAELGAVVHLGDGLSLLQRRRQAGDAERADRLVAASSDLVLAVREAHVPLFVYLSSIKVLCDEEDDRVLVETSEPRGSTLYGRSKLRIERSLVRTLSGSATRCVIVRAPVVYGEGKTGSVHRLLELADTPLPLPLDGVCNKRSVLAACNLANLLVHLLRTGVQPAGSLFHVHDGPPWSTTQIVTTLRAALGRSRRLFSIGAPAQRAFKVVPLLAPVARRLYGSLELSDGHFRGSSAWKPVVDTETALIQMARKLRV
jgi:nucleoside-diphosphate-sugar epimerase